MADDSSQDTEASGNLRLWKKGQSGNPGGQPKWIREVREALRACAERGAVRLMEIIETGEHKDVIAATRLAMEYTIRKPKQTHKVTVGGDPLRSVPEDQLVAFVKGETK